MATISHQQFVDELFAEFPTLQKFVRDAMGNGLLHVETGCFASYTQAAIDEGNKGELARCFAFATRVFQNANPDVKNALYVSYLEQLNFKDGNSRRAWALDVMPPALKAGWIEINLYLDELFQKGEAMRAGKGKRPSE